MAEPSRLPRSSICVLLVLVLATLLHPSAALEYIVSFNSTTPGGMRFNQEFTDSLVVLDNATTFIQGALSLSTFRVYDSVTLTVKSFEGVAQTGGSEIQLSEEYVASQPPAPALHYEIEGVLFHEMTYVWQNNNGSYGTDQFFTGVIEGVADWIRLKAGFSRPRSPGGNWYDGYTTTAYFLDWIETTQKPNFVNELNLKMAESWSNDFFLQLVGRSVDELWTDYQKQHLRESCEISNRQCIIQL